MELYLVRGVVVPGSRWGLFAPCALEMYSEASIVITFPCGPRILAEFGMVASAWCSATYFGVSLYFLHGAGCRIYIIHLSCCVDKPFFVKITNCVDFSLPLPTFFVLRRLSCCYCCFPACWFSLMSFMFVIITLWSFFFCTFVWRFFCVHSLRFYSIFLCWNVGIV